MIERSNVMGKPTGFLEYERVDGPLICDEERFKNFLEFHGMLDKAARE